MNSTNLIFYNGYSAEQANAFKDMRESTTVDRQLISIETNVDWKFLAVDVLAERWFFYVACISSKSKVLELSSLC